MDAHEILAELKSLGTAQNQKTFRRHGVHEELYGVSYADLDRLKKRIRTDHALALALWQSGVHDARILATKVADPALMDETQLDSWVRDLENYIASDALSGLASKTPLAHQKMEQWTQSEEEWVGRTGWLMLANLALYDRSLPDEYFAPYLEIIQAGIHNAKNYVRDAMNTALISIGMRGADLEAQALARAAEIGKVQVDHGDTSCKTPDAAGYILKARQRKEARQKT